MRLSRVLSLFVAVLVSRFYKGDSQTAYFARSTVTSSSELSPNYSASHAAFFSLSAWCPQQNFTASEYLQLDFGSVKVVKEIQIAGEASPPNNQTARQVTKYLIRVSADGVTYEDFEEISRTNISLQIWTRYIRIVPLEFVIFPCMRIEFYGCKAKDPELCSEQNGGCSQTCIQHSKYCLFGKCFFDCHIDFLCKKWVECQCDPGYKLMFDNKSCEDVNECTTKNGNCDHVCNNSQGSYECKCHQGYVLNSDKHKCDDINECNGNSGGCNQFCHNTVGGYYCSCRNGYQLSSDNHTCNDIDECTLNLDGCSYGCQNLYGTYRCTCPQGFKLDQTGKNCVDSNECLLGNGGCEKYCTNTNGSYYCSCLPGFELYDQFLCRDIDECAQNNGGCSAVSTDCHNHQGGYECRCKKGYKYIPDNDFSCERISCHPLVEAAGTSVAPAECLLVDGRKVNDTCTFSCNEGYKLPDPNQTTLTCLDSGAWDKALISCHRKSCPALPPIDDGTLTPSFCAVTGNVFESGCYYTCNSGYSLKGTSARTCQANGEWDINATPTCEKVHPQPWITCPSAIVVDLEPNEKEYDATAVLGQPESSVQNIQMFPEKYRNSSVFPYGLTELTYVASNEVGDTANCTTFVSVHDNQPPRIVYCPGNIYQAIAGFGASVTWQEPEFTDNVEVAQVTSTHNSGDYFTLGSRTVKYDAFDPSGLFVSCSFNIQIIQKKCVIPENPDNGILECQVFGTFYFCQIKCNGSKQLFQYTGATSCNTHTLAWGPIPDCVDAVLMPDSGVCPSGKIKQEALTQIKNPYEYCVNCPRGMMYDSDSKNCIDCLVGYISQQESSPVCSQCPLKKSTRTEGSKECIDLCDKGQSSIDGFNDPNHDVCSLCLVGFYQDQYGATECKPCPGGLTTLTNGTTSLSDCGTAPSISSFGPPSMMVNVSENSRAELVCMGAGTPAPTFLVQKNTTVPAGFVGPLEVEYMYSGNVVIGIRYIIVSATEHDTGLYFCTVTNRFGSYKKYLNLYVHLDFGGGGSGSGAGQ